MSFNLSHTRGCILIAVSSDRAVGVDVEHLAAEGAEDVAADVLAPDELAVLACLKPTARRHRFYECWTLKEAYAKARSVGLAMPFRQCAFSFDGDRITFQPGPSIDDDASRWRFWQFNLDRIFVAAVCGEVNSAGRPSIDVKIMPGFPYSGRPFEVSRTCSS